MSVTHTSPAFSASVKYRRLPSVVNSERFDSRAGSSNDTSRVGVPPAAGMDQKLERP